MPSQYTKPSLSCIDQLSLLKQRGLIIDDDKKALHLLEHIGYYRLSGYWYTLLDTPKADHRFKSQSTFNAAFRMYCFDRELRQLVLGEIEKIEVAVKSQISHVYSAEFGAQWYANPALFNNKKNRHTDTIKSLRVDYSRSKEDFVFAFKGRYTEESLPCWIMMEVASLGNVSCLYDDLKGGKWKRAVSHRFGLDDSTFASWLHCVAHLRNICAHHSRFWNREFRVYPQKPRNPSNDWLNNVSVNNRSYFALSMIVYLLQTINPKNTFKHKLINLLDKYPNIDIRSMGFPASWKSEMLWRT